MPPVSAISARPFTFALIAQDHALRAISALYGYPVKLADIVALGFMGHCNDSGQKCGFMMVYNELRRAGRMRNKTQTFDMVQRWLSLGLVERGKNKNKFANLSLKLTPAGRLLLFRFEALLKKEAEKGIDPGDQV